MWSTKIISLKTFRYYFDFSSLRLSMEDSSELLKASAESGVLPFDVAGEVLLLIRPKSLCGSEFSMDQGRGFGATTGGATFTLEHDEESVRSKTE